MPLSEYEQRVLDQLEAQLASEDPKLGSRMAAAAAPRRSRVALGAAGAVMGLALLVLGVAVQQEWVSLGGFLLMFAGAYFALSKPRKAGAAPAAAKPPKGKAAPKPGLSDRFQKRFEDRDGL
ncbi:MAG: DUF3040 domain-containing protein [Bifidobacteriaceae bacterium]|jgi:protein-S-isoprenylcysteine O-methyltransferase Ste14|nr:DUF3040 domain-containing protein [Bifidobacteriaceae bacterium]